MKPRIRTHLLSTNRLPWPLAVQGLSFHGSRGLYVAPTLSGLKAWPHIEVVRWVYGDQIARFEGWLQSDPLKDAYRVYVEAPGRPKEIAEALSQIRAVREALEESRRIAEENERNGKLAESQAIRHFLTLRGPGSVEIDGIEYLPTYSGERLLLAPKFKGGASKIDSNSVYGKLATEHKLR